MVTSVPRASPGPTAPLEASLAAAPPAVSRSGQRKLLWLSGGLDAHWLAIACEPGEPDLLFDTFARPPTATWLPHLRHMETTDPDVNQQQHSRRCGQLCMAFGHVFLNHGRPVARMC